MLYSMICTVLYFWVVASNFQTQITPIKISPMLSWSTISDMCHITHPSPSSPVGRKKHKNVTWTATGWVVQRSQSANFWVGLLKGYESFGFTNGFAIFLDSLFIRRFISCIVPAGWTIQRFTQDKRKQITYMVIGDEYKSGKPWQGTCVCWALHKHWFTVDVWSVNKVSFIRHDTCTPWTRV